MNVEAAIKLLLSSNKEASGMIQEVDWPAGGLWRSDITVGFIFPPLLVLNGMLSLLFYSPLYNVAHNNRSMSKFHNYVLVK